MRAMEALRYCLGLKSCLASALLCTVDIVRPLQMQSADRKRHGAPGGVLFSNRSFERHAKEVRARRCLMFDLCLVFNSRPRYELGEGTRTHTGHTPRARHHTRPDRHRTDRTPRDHVRETSLSFCGPPLVLRCLRDTAKTSEEMVTAERGERRHQDRRIVGASRRRRT
jgi:hypothetical protein